MAPTKTKTCDFFPKGRCRNGDSCEFIHERVTSTQSRVNLVASTSLNIEYLSINPTTATHVSSTVQATPDSRGKIRCRFLSSPGGCRNDPCPYLHPANGGGVLHASNDIVENEVGNYSTDFSLEIFIYITHRPKNAETILLEIFRVP